MLFDSLQPSLRGHAADALGRVAPLRGPELIPTAEGDGTDISNWTVASATIEAVGGEFLVTTSVANHNVRHTVSVAPGKTYEFRWGSRLGTMTTLKTSIFNVTGLVDIIPVTVYTAGNNRLTFTAPVGCVSAAIYLVRDSGVTGTAFFDNISVREVTGFLLQ